jgi:hypothetical protein
VRSLGLVAVVVVFAAVLAGLLWLTAYFIAPPLFGALWRGASSPWTAQLLAATPALLVGVPFGLAFGVLPWRRVMPMALAVAVLAAGADLVSVMRTGIDPTGAQGRLYAIADALFIVLFVGAALAARHLTRGTAGARRGWLGAWSWLVLAAGFCAAAAWSYAHVMPRGVQ